MHFCTTLALFVCILTTPLSIFGQNGGHFEPAGASYLWPTNASNYISSTFAETRSRHFHAALDLKTWGRNGYNVYATRDGILHRIAIGPTGYGKVVYLKHDDGSYSLYAHLLRFEKNIQQVADSIRMRNHSFELDQTLDSLNIQIRQGDVIGLSGATGIGPPHLHFELRTPNEQPFNPLLTNLKVKDNVPPRFLQLSVEPLSPVSKVEGRQGIYTKRLLRGNTFSIVDVEGPVGLGVNVYDQANDVYNAYAVYDLKMYVNDQLLFHSKVDSFGYHETDQMFLDRVYPILKGSRAGFQRLYIADGNTLPFYQNTGHTGKLNLPEGMHQVKIVAKDYYGNTKEAALRLRVHSSSELGEKQTTSSLSSRRLETAGDKWTWFSNWVTIPQSSFESLITAPLGLDCSCPAEVSKAKYSVNVNLTQARDVFFRRSAQDHFIARRVYPRKFSVVPATMHNTFATFDPGTVYDTLSVGITHKVYRRDSIQVDVFPDNRPIRKPYMLAYEIDSTQASLPNFAFYAYNKRRNRLKYLQTEKIDSYLIAYPKALGTFIALSDTIPPVIKRPSVVRQADDKWVVMLGVRDNLSGIDYHRSVIYVNGIRGVAEYEPEDNRLLYYHPEFEPRKQNTVRVTVYDRLGNKKSRTFVLDS